MDQSPLTQLNSVKINRKTNPASAQKNKKKINREIKITTTAKVIKNNNQISTNHNNSNNNNNNNTV